MGSTPLKNISLVSWDDEIPDIWKKKLCSKPPTSKVLQCRIRFWQKMRRISAILPQVELFEYVTINLVVARTWYTYGLRKPVMKSLH